MFKILNFLHKGGLGSPLLFLLVGAVFFSCEKPTVPPAEPAARLAPYFADSIPYPERNVLSDEGIALGKALFFDPRLSSNEAVSCAMCHQPPLAFSDGEALTNTGVSGKPLLRHSPVLFNLAWHEGFFWDGGAKDLESQAFGPLQHPDEMGVDLKELVQKLRKHPDYPAQFKAVFGVDSLQSAHIARALAQYQRTLISDESLYDKFVQKEAKLSKLALRGKALFEKHCARCHTPPFFTDFAYHNNGLDTAFSEAHEQMAWGRGRITQDSADIGKYKTATLRNVEVSAPYMHDGRFATLEEVLRHYSEGIKTSHSVDSLLVGGLQLTAKEQADLIQFLHSLTDSAFCSQIHF